MADPYDLIAAAQKAATLSRIKNGFPKNAVKAGSTMGLKSPVQNETSGSSSSPSTVTRNYSAPVGSSAPVSTLASVPMTPELQSLIDKGLVREGMPVEQILAILSFQQLAQLGPINLDDLMNQIRANYEQYTGDILTSGADWMRELYGTNFDPNDPNAALFAQDPLFSSYAGGLAQMDETADTNLATDLSWFEKQQQAQQDYLNNMMLAISAGALGETSGSGGGGGGGHHGGGYGGGGGGSNDSDGDWTDPRTRLTETAVGQDTAYQNLRENNPGWYDDMVGIFAGDPNAQQWARDFFERYDTPQEAGPKLVDAADEIATQLEAGDLIDASNALWEANATGSFPTDALRFMQLTGLTPGDNPDTPELEFYTQSDSPPPVLNIEDANWVAQFRPAFEQAYDPQISQFLNQAFNKPDFMQAFAQKRLNNPYTPTLQGAHDRIFRGLNLTAPTIAPQEDIPTGFAMPLAADEVGPPRRGDFNSPQDVIQMIQSLAETEGIDAADQWKEENQQYFGPDVLADPMIQYSLGEGNFATLYQQQQEQLAQEQDNNNFIQSLQRSLDNPQGLHFFMQDTFPTLSSAQQRAVREIIERHQQASVANAFRQVQAQMQQGNLQGIVDRAAASGKVKQAPLQNPDWQFNAQGELYPHIMDTLKRQSVLDRQNAPVNPITGDIMAAEGQYYNDQTTSPEEREEMENILLWIQAARDLNRERNTNTAFAPESNALINMGRETAQVQDQSTTYDPAYAAITGIGDPEDYTLEEIDPLTSRGAFGYARGIQIPRAPKIPVPKQPVTPKQTIKPVQVKKLAAKRTYKPSKMKTNLSLKG